MKKGQINPIVDIKINKSDIFDIIILQKQEELEEEIKKVKEKENKLHKKIENKTEELTKKILKATDCPKNAYVNSRNILYSTGPNFIKRKELMAIRYLEKLSNPSRVRKQYIDYHAFYNKKLESSIEVLVDKNIKGFKGTLRKILNIEVLDFEKEVKEINKLREELFDTECELNELEYKELILPYDKNIKKEFLKKIIKENDIKTLLN